MPAPHPDARRPDEPSVHWSTDARSAPGNGTPSDEAPAGRSVTSWPGPLSLNSPGTRTRNLRIKRPRPPSIQSAESVIWAFVRWEVRPARAVMIYPGRLAPASAPTVRRCVVYAIHPELPSPSDRRCPRPARRHLRRRPADHEMRRPPGARRLFPSRRGVGEGHPQGSVRRGRRGRCCRRPHRRGVRDGPRRCRSPRLPGSGHGARPPPRGHPAWRCRARRPGEATSRRPPGPRPAGPTTPPAPTGTRRRRRRPAPRSWRCASFQGRSTSSNDARNTTRPRPARRSASWWPSVVLPAAVRPSTPTSTRRRPNPSTRSANSSSDADRHPHAKASLTPTSSRRTRRRGVPNGERMARREGWPPVAEVLGRKADTPAARRTASRRCPAHRSADDALPSWPRGRM